MSPRPGLVRPARLLGFAFAALALLTTASTGAPTAGSAPVADPAPITLEGKRLSPEAELRYEKERAAWRARRGERLAAARARASGEYDRGPAIAHGTPLPPVPERGYDVLAYRLDLTLALGGTRHLAGTCTIELVVAGGVLDSLVFDQRQLQIQSVTVNGTPRGFATNESPGELRVELSEQVGDSTRASGETLWVEVAYEATPTRGYFEYPRNAYTFVEPYDARHWFPCNDAPADKALLPLLRLTVPDTVVVGSQGFGSASPASGGTRVWTWQHAHPIATYLVSFVAANYEVWSDEAFNWGETDPGQAIPLHYYVHPEDVSASAIDFERVPVMISEFSRRFGRYPFEKYGMAMVEPFLGILGMEHQTLSTINAIAIHGDRRSESLYAHELAHQWFGDSVTPVDFGDIWLNEGFATYSEALWAEVNFGAAGRELRMSQAASTYITESVTTNYPLVDPPAQHLFGATVYQKGAWILHMLRGILGDEAFFAVLRTYADTFADANATSEDFQALVEARAGEDLSWFFDPWLHGVGYPVFEPTWEVTDRDDGTADVELRIAQVQVTPTRFTVPLDVELRSAAGATRHRVVVGPAGLDTTLRAGARPSSVVLDPDAEVLKLVKNPLAVPADSAVIAIARVFPNPATGPVRIELSLNSPGLPLGQSGDLGQRSLSLAVYDARGRLVKTLARGPLTAGPLTVLWDGSGEDGLRRAAGLYFLRLSSPLGEETRRIVLIR